jgi:hypothetical protein
MIIQQVLNAADILTGRALLLDRPTQLHEPFPSVLTTSFATGKYLLPAVCRAAH